jgi:hypothetical protein
VATRKQQRRKYQRAQGRGRLYEGSAPRPGDDDKPQRSKQRARGPREPARPTWTRSLKRAALFASGLFLFVTLVPLGGSKTSTAAAALQAASFFVFMVPFGYLMDGFIYNRWVKRQQG